MIYHTKWHALALVPFIFAKVAFATPVHLKFTNGTDTLTGEIISVDGKKQEMIVASEAIKQPIAIDTRKTLSATLINTKAPEGNSDTDADHLASLTLSDRYSYTDQRDLIKGQLTNITEDTVSLKTWYAGDLTIDRSLLHTIDITSLHASHYTGPNSLEEWTRFGDEDAWTYKNGALIRTTKNGALGKELDIPDKAVFSFDIDWKKQQNQRIIFYFYATDTSSENPEAFYQLQFYSNTINMSRYSREERSQQLDRMPRTTFSVSSPSASYTIYMDKNKGEFHLYRDGEKLYTFRQRAPSKSNFGSAFFITNSNSPVLIKNLRLHNWNGILPDTESELPGEITNSKEAILSLANGDGVAGKITHINNSVIEIETKYTPIQIPLKVINQIKLQPKKKNQAKAEFNDIKAYYKNGGWIRITLDSIDDTHIHGSNEAFGATKFELDAFKKIEWNIYDSEQNRMRSNIDW